MISSAPLGQRHILLTCAGHQHEETLWVRDSQRVQELADFSGSAGYESTLVTLPTYPLPRLISSSLNQLFSAGLNLYL